MIDLEEGGFLIMEKINEVPGQVSFGRALKDFLLDILITREERLELDISG